LTADDQLFLRLSSGGCSAGEQLAKLVLGANSFQPVDFLAIDNKHAGRHGADLKLASQFRLLFDVNRLDRIAFTDQTVDRRLHRLTGTAGRMREFEQDHVRSSGQRDEQSQRGKRHHRSLLGFVVQAFQAAIRLSRHPA
jgi:hypothetical protein